MATEKSIFDKLFSINVNDHTEKKNGLTYLSWAYAWAEVKKLYPNANYIVYERADGVNYFTDGKTCWVKTGVVIDGLEHIEYLPVMDYNNRSIPLDKVTSFDVNKAIQRSLTKACARHGLGLYVYAGEDLPEDMTSAEKETTVEKKPLDKKLLKKCETLKINLEKLAVYLKKDVDDLTDDDLKSAIKAKENAIAKAKAAAATADPLAKGDNTNNG